MANRLIATLADYGHEFSSASLEHAKDPSLCELPRCLVPGLRRPPRRGGSPEAGPSAAAGGLATVYPIAVRPLDSLTFRAPLGEDIRDVPGGVAVVVNEAAEDELPAALVGGADPDPARRVGQFPRPSMPCRSARQT
jgi:hypothetical protein